MQSDKCPSAHQTLSVKKNSHKELTLIFTYSAELLLSPLFTGEKYKSQDKWEMPKSTDIKSRHGINMVLLHPILVLFKGAINVY